MKNILISLLVLILAVIFGGVIYLFTFDVNTYKGSIEKFLLDHTGYAVSIQGEMSLSKSLKPNLVLRDVEIKNAAGFSEPVFFKAKEAEVSFDLLLFLKDIIKVQRINFSDVDVFLQVNEVGHDNWSRLPKTQRVGENKKERKRPTLSKAESLSPAEQAEFDLITMRNVKISYDNKQDNINNVFVLNKLAIDHLVNIEGELLSNQEKFNFSGSVKNLLSVIVNKRDLNFSFSVNGLDGSSKISGVCRDLTKCEDDIILNINSQGTDLKKVYEFFMIGENDVPATAYSFQFAGRLLKRQLLMDGVLEFTSDGVSISYNVEQNLDSKEGKGRVNIDVSKPDLVRRFGLRTFSAQANYNVVLDKSLDISNLTLMFDETDIDGSLNVDLSAKKPVISGKLHSHYFKFSNIFEKNPLTNLDDELSIDDSLFSKSKINLSWLDKFDATLSLSIDNFSAKNLFSRYPVIISKVQLKDSVLDVRLLENSFIAGGQVVGKLVIDAENAQKPNWNLELVGENLMFNQVSSWKKQLLNGVFNVNLFLTAEGNTQKDIWSSLNGYLLLSANQVEILSPLVADLFAENDANGTYRASKDLFVKCAVVNAVVNNGVVSFDKKVAVETSRFNMLISGDVNFDKETINLHLAPQKNAVDRYGQSTGVMRAVVLSGNLAEPKASVETNNASGNSEDGTTKHSKLNSKRAVLDAYTTKKVVEGVSICRVASADMQLKTIDDYFGRVAAVASEKTEQKQEKKTTEQTKAQKLGRELLNTLSDVLNDKDEDSSD
ncbi:MAG: AsmA family protein [Alphaproteobacteria bacterium]|nr:AsmA family protein [Alphaproteobacteria bacterium]